MKTEAEIKLEKITNEINSLKAQDRLKADVAYTHLTSIIKWLIATIIIMFVTIFGSVIWFLDNFDIMTESFELEQVTESGNANYIGNDGDIYNGISEN